MPGSCITSQADTCSRAMRQRIRRRLAQPLRSERKEFVLGSRRFGGILSRVILGVLCTAAFEPLASLSRASESRSVVTPELDLRADATPIVSACALHV